MFRIQNTARSLAAIAALVLIAAAPPADPQGRGGGRGGGGGGGGTGGGTIYYVGPWEGATGFGTAQMTAMNSDGSNVTWLGLGMFGNPSTEEHNGHRWFIYTKPIADSYYPNGVQRSKVMAFRDDYSSTNNTAETRVRLTYDDTLQPGVGTTDWVPGGQKISFKGARWSGTGVGDTVVEGGVYTASLEFSADGNIIGLVAEPTAPAIPFAMTGAGWPNMGEYSWGPDGDRIVYEAGAWDLWIADLFGEHTLLRSSGTSKAPQWSPKGDKIAFSNGSGVFMIKPDGSGFKKIISNTSTMRFYRPYWSPTASHIVLTGQEKEGWPPNMDVYRATSRGSKLTNLTNTAFPLTEYITAYSGGGWR